MSRISRNLALAATLSLAALSAQASSCDPNQPTSVDSQIVNYNESNCAKNALKIAADYFQDASKAQAKGEYQHMCSTVYSALMQLEKYKAGDWRGNYKNIAEKIDHDYAEVLDNLMKTTCPQKTILYRFLAAKGDAWAMYNLGSIYAKGNGVPLDDAEALAWYQKAAEKEYTAAYLALGLMYSDGVAFLPDFVTAFEWYMKAAAQGDATAQYTVAGMYRKGTGTKQDSKKAAEWYKKATDQKHEGAKAKLEEMYKTGEAKKPGFSW